MPKRRNIRFKSVKAKPTNIETQPKKSFKFFRLAAKGIAGVVVLFALIEGYLAIKKEFGSTKSKYNEEMFVEGNLKFPKLQPSSETNTDELYELLERPPILDLEGIKDSLPPVKGIIIKSKIRDVGFIFGNRPGYLIKRSDLIKGIKLRLSEDTLAAEISVVIVEDKLYVSLEFKDLEKEETIGMIDYNHWKLYKPNLLDYESTDRQLDVLDKQNNLVCSIGCMGSDDVGNMVL